MTNQAESLDADRRSKCHDPRTKSLLDELGIKTRYCTIGNGVKSVLGDYQESCHEQINEYATQIAKERLWKHGFVAISFGSLLAFPVVISAIDPVVEKLVEGEVWSSSSIAAAAVSGILALHKSFSAWFRTRYREGSLREAKAKLEDQRLTLKSSWYGRAELNRCADRHGGGCSAASLRLGRAKADASVLLSSLVKAIADREDAKASNSEAQLANAEARVEAAKSRMTSICSDVLEAELALNDEVSPTTRLGKEIADSEAFDPEFLQAVIAATRECRAVTREESAAHFAQMKLPDVDLSKNLTGAQTSAKSLLTAFMPQATAGAQKAADIAAKQSALTGAERNLKMLSAERDRVRGLVSALEAAKLDASDAKADLKKSETLRVQAYQEFLNARSALLFSGGHFAS